jgi:DNA-binding NarL/FixJ family response regulator
MLRVLHCDDSRSFLVLVQDWFEDYDDLELVCSTSEIREAVRGAKELAPDVIVTDTFGSPSTAEFVLCLRDAAPGCRVVLFTGYLLSQLHPDVVAAVDRVVVKGIDEQALVAVLRSLDTREA